MTSPGWEEVLLDVSFQLHNTQVGEEFGDFLLTLTDLHSVSLVVLEGETLAPPIDGGLLGADGEVLKADGVPSTSSGQART